MTPFTPPAATIALPAPVAQSNQIYGGPERSHGPQLRKTPTNIKKNLKKKRGKNHKTKLKCLWGNMNVTDHLQK